MKTKCLRAWESDKSPLATPEKMPLFALLFPNELPLLFHLGRTQDEVFGSMPRVIRAEVMRLGMLNGARAAEVFQPCVSSFFCLMNAKNVITMQHVGALFKPPVRFRD